MPLQRWWVTSSHYEEIKDELGIPYTWCSSCIINNPKNNSERYMVLAIVYIYSEQI